MLSEVLDVLFQLAYIDEVGEIVRGHHSPPPITPATSDSPRYIPPHKQP